MNANNNDLKTNQLDSVQTSLVCPIESEAEEMLIAGQNAHAKGILDASNKLFLWGSAAMNNSQKSNANDSEKCHLMMK